MNKLKKIALRVIAESLSDVEVEGIRKGFDLIDTKKQSKINIAELTAESYTNLFTIKCHYYGKFNDGPKKEYIEGYVEKHKVMDVYVEIVEKKEESKSGSNSASESDNDFEDEEHVVQEVKVNMGDFNFRVKDASTGTDGNMIPVAPRPNVDNAVKGKIVNEDAEEDKITCPWLLYLSKGDKGKWFIKTFKDEHHCLQSRKIKYCTSTFLSKHITDLIIMNPNMPIKAIQEQMQKKFHVAVSRGKAFRAKAKAAVSLRGDVKIQYALLRDYDIWS
ncbi:hypothetical protein Tco_0117673 [Tanacetum coccineum]